MFKLRDYKFYVSYNGAVVVGSFSLLRVRAVSTSGRSWGRAWGACALPRLLRHGFNSNSSFHKVRDRKSQLLGTWGIDLDPVSRGQVKSRKSWKGRLGPCPLVFRVVMKRRIKPNERGRAGRLAVIVDRWTLSTVKPGILSSKCQSFRVQERLVTSTGTQTPALRKLL